MTSVYAVIVQNTRLLLTTITFAIAGALNNVTIIYVFLCLISENYCGYVTMFVDSLLKLLFIFPLVLLLQEIKLIYDFIP